MSSHEFYKLEYFKAFTLGYPSRDQSCKTYLVNKLHCLSEIDVLVYHLLVRESLQVTCTYRTKC
jgi:hypothetical protein